MFFYNKKLLREAGYDDAFIEAMPQRALDGDLTLDEVIDIAKQVVDKTGIKYGILHRGNKGPDFMMVFHAYGNNFVDPETGNLLIERDKLAKAFGWFERGTKEGVIAANLTAMENPAISKEFYTENGAFWMYGIWDLGSVAFPTYGLPSDEAAYFADWGWIAVPPAEKGGSASSLTHPIVYAVASDAADPELAVRLLALASDATLNTDHAVTTTHLGIKPEQLEDPRYAGAWPLARASDLLEITKFMPEQPAVRRPQQHPLHRDPGRGEREADGGGSGRLRHRRGFRIARGCYRAVAFHWASGSPGRACGPAPGSGRSDDDDRE